MGQGFYMSKDGYRYVNLRTFPPDVQALARQHLKIKNQSNGLPGYYVPEHRLVALQKYGPSVLRRGIVIRHLDGDKLNNKPENIAPGTNKSNRIDHATDHRQMVFWRTFATFLFCLLMKEQPR